LLPALFLSLCALAPQEEIPELSRPDPARPTEVQVSAYVIDVTLVEEPTHSFRADVVFVLDWKDPRLAMPGAAVRRVDADDAWHPRTVLLNERGASSRLGDDLRVGPDGTVRQVRRFVGSFGSRFDLRDFPLDSQTLRFELVFLDTAEGELEITLGDANGRRDPLSIADWSVDPARVSVEAIALTPQLSLPGLVLEIPVRRRIGYYVWKILLPLVLIVGMAGTVFWIDPRNMGPQLSVSASSMLTLIAYRFSLGNLVPRLSYMTRLDHFILGATLMVFAALVEVIVTSGLASNGHHERAVRIDRVARVAYVLTLVWLLLRAFVW